MNRPLPSSTASTLSAQPPPVRRKSRSPNSSAGDATAAALPAKHPSCPGSPAKPPRASASTSSPGSGWGAQWSTLQGLASSVLGSDALAAEQTLKQRRQRPSSLARENTGHGSMRPRARRRADAPPPPPNGSAGSRPPSVRGGGNSNVIYKRATSPHPEDGIEVGDMEGGSDILVYVHSVKPTDTVEGVVIAFNISPGALRKANGMWSHDSVQSRRTLLLPVDECQVKGKPVTLLNAENGSRPGGGAETEAEGEEEKEKAYKHESYVIIEGIGQVEIARLARKKLSHFPPRRRKSTNAKRLSGLGELPAVPSLLDEPLLLLDPLEEPASPTNVFRGMTPGVGELHPQNHANPSVHPGVAIGPEAFTFKSLGELATDTAAGLENIGGAVEGFMRKWTAKAQGFVGGDLIELTQRLGFELEEEDQNRRGGETMRRGGSAGSSGSSSSRGRGAGMERVGSGSGRDGGGRRVVRERLTRRDGGEGSRDRGRAKVL